MAFIEWMNADCVGITLDAENLCRALKKVMGDPSFCRDLITSHPHLLSGQPLYLSGQTTNFRSAGGGFASVFVGDVLAGRVKLTLPVVMGLCLVR